MAEEQSLRELLDAKFVDTGEPPASAAPSDAPSNEPPAQGELPLGEPPAQVDKPGVEAPASGAPGETPPPTVPAPSGDVKQPTPAPQGAVGAGADKTAPSIKAPQSWRPEVREHWGKLPLEVQQEIIRREQHVSRALQEASRYVQHYNQFNETCAPYMSLIAMDGGNPMNTFKEYLQTAAILRMGATNEKANAVASAIVKFGVDVRELDTALAAHFNGQQPQGAPQQQFRDPRLDHLLGTMQHRQELQDREVTERQLTEIETFSRDPAHEFFQDVRPMVANILEVYANQGIKCSLKDAYDKACMLHPEISKIVHARTTAAAANNLVKQNQSAIAAKRAAASNPPGAPNIAPIDGAALSLRDTINAAMNASESRA